LRILVAKLIRIIDSFFDKCFNFFRILKLKLKYPGLTIDFGSYIDADCNITCVDGGIMKIYKTSIMEGSFVFCDYSGTLSISKGFIGRNSTLVAKEKIEIGEKCLIAESVTIRDQDHAFNENQDMADSEFYTAPIKIERNVWIGAKATILKGISICEGSVVGSNGVVTKSLLEKGIYVGIPVKLIKKL